MLNFFPGAKTYLIGAGMIAYGLLGMAMGWLDQAEAGRIILEGAGLVTVLWSSSVSSAMDRALRAGGAGVIPFPLRSPRQHFLSFRVCLPLSVIVRNHL